MKQYNVEITSPALDDMNSIYDYIAKAFQEPETAMLQYDRIAEKIRSLETLPDRCKQIVLAPQLHVVRQLIVDNYSIIYTIENSSVIVLRVLYSSSDIASRLQFD